jgi:hypothetical protein
LEDTIHYVLKHNDIFNKKVGEWYKMKNRVNPRIYTIRSFKFARFETPIKINCVFYLKEL